MICFFLVMGKRMLKNKVEGRSKRIRDQDCCRFAKSKQQMWTIFYTSCLDNPMNADPSSKKSRGCFPFVAVSWFVLRVTTRKPTPSFSSLSSWKLGLFPPHLVFCWLCDTHSLRTFHPRTSRINNNLRLCISTHSLPLAHLPFPAHQSFAISPSP